MIKLIIFDLDGVLVDSRELHYIALNKSLERIDKKYIISYEEHIAKYDGKSTKTKLQLLTKEKNLPINLYNKIWQYKQENTIIAIKEKFTYDKNLCNMLKKLKQEGYLLYCASNSIFNTIKIILLKTGMIEYIDYFISNQEVKNPKPHSEIYYKCLIRSNLSPKEVLILEDSPIGRLSAKKTGAYVLEINNLSDVNYLKISSYIQNINFMNKKKVITNKWKGKINVVIPMAGEGSRFKKKGFTFPKPLIDINGKSMIEVVVNNLNIDGKYIFIVRKEHYNEYNLKYLLNLITNNNCEIIIVDKLTDGAACTVLLSKKYINNENQLLIANSDQFLEWDSNSFLYEMQNKDIDAGISVFKSTHPKWSFAKLDDNGFVIEVAEKKPISNIATTGIYYWKKGSDFVKYVEKMIEKNVKHNNEFYVCPVFNQAISDKKKIKVSYCKRMWGLGTPEDLDYYLKNYYNNIK